MGAFSLLPHCQDTGKHHTDAAKAGIRAPVDAPRGIEMPERVQARVLRRALGVRDACEMIHT